MNKKEMKKLEKFAFWNNKKAKKVFDLNKKANKEDVLKLHTQKCGLCGS
jgi:hypothetical protein